MPFPMPMWPLRLGSAATRALVAGPLRRRWIIVEDAVRREVDETEYRSALASCNRIEVARDPHADVVTSLCFRAPP
jgi:hypothetical protein